MKKTVYDTLCDRVRAERKKLKLSQEEMARLLCIPTSVIQSIECGAAPSLISIVQIADKLHLTLDDLCGRTPPGKV